MLSLKNIVVHYGGVQALKGVSLDVEKGSITSLIGANGAGKSTTLRAISGLAPITAGEIWFEDHRIDGLPPEKIVEMGIGHVPEGKQLFLEMSVQDNLLTGAYLRKDEEGIRQDLERVYGYFPVLRRYRHKRAFNLSGGEQQMVAIGRGLMCRPKLLLLDEPSLGLSPLLTIEVGSIIKRIAEEGVSILLIEQNANLALQLSRKCYVMETGTIVIEGTGEELQNNEHVRAAYLGLTPTEAPPERFRVEAGAPWEAGEEMPERWTERMPPDIERHRGRMMERPESRPEEVPGPELESARPAAEPVSAFRWLEEPEPRRLERQLMEARPSAGAPSQWLKEFEPGERWSPEEEPPDRWGWTATEPAAGKGLEERAGFQGGPARVVKKSFVPRLRP